MGLYSIRLILQGTFLQKSASSRASCSPSLKSLNTMNSNVGRVPVLPWKCRKASANTDKLLVSLMAMMWLRFSSLAACKLKAKLNFTSSSPSLLMALAMPAVDTVMRFGDMANPGVPVMRSTDSNTLR